MRIRPAIWIAVVVVACVQAAAAKDIALISNKDNSAKNISLPELVKICKGQSLRWADGRLLTVVIREPSAPDMKIVLQKVYGMTAGEVNELIASANHGRSDRPAIVVVSSDDTLVKKVGSIPGAVGLVDVYSITGGINVLKVGGKLPLEPGYVLHGN